VLPKDRGGTERAWENWSRDFLRGVPATLDGSGERVFGSFVGKKLEVHYFSPREFARALEREGGVSRMD